MGITVVAVVLQCHTIFRCLRDRLSILYLTLSMSAGALSASAGATPGKSIIPIGENILSSVWVTLASYIFPLP